MRPSGRHIGLLAAAVLLTANWPSRRVSPGATTLGRRRSVGLGAPSFPAYVVGELGVLHGGTTPAAWLRAHPTDSLVPFDHELVLEDDDRWCARAIARTTLADGTRVLRFAYFYPPATPPSLSLPSTEDSQLIRKQCRLGAIWLESPAVASPTAPALAAQTREALIQVYGPVQAAPAPWYAKALTDSSKRPALSQNAGREDLRLGIHFSRAGYWHVLGRWQSDSAVVVSAYDHGEFRGAVKNSYARVLACAFLPFAGMGSVGANAAAYQPRPLAAEAASLSGLDRGRVDRLLAVLPAAETADQSPGRLSAETTVAALLTSTLSDWLTASAGLDSSHRAAALLAADQVLASQAVTDLVALDSTRPAREALSRLGAEFAHDELGGLDYYTHTWLDEALRLDSEGRAGQLAKVVLLRIGFREKGGCGQEDASQRVTAEGEELLQSVTDPAIAAEVHLLVAEGYADAVSRVYTTAASEERSTAIRHYRQGIALDPSSPHAHAAWLETWRLLAGLPPTTTHFVCAWAD